MAHGRRSLCERATTGTYGLPNTTDSVQPFGFFAPEKNFHGGYSVAGAQTPVAAGLAYALKHKDIPGAVICVLGDGALNQGCVHESFNLASLFNLPVVYLIENNQFSMGTSVPRHSKFRDCLAKRAEAKAEALAATEFAEASPVPTTEDILKNVYSEDLDTRTTQGRLFFND